jgi:hypothetical protein
MRPGSSYITSTYTALAVADPTFVSSPINMSVYQPSALSVTRTRSLPAIALIYLFIYLFISVPVMRSVKCSHFLGSIRIGTKSNDSGINL